MYDFLMTFLALTSILCLGCERETLTMYDKPKKSNSLLHSNNIQSEGVISIRYKTDIREPNVNDRVLFTINGSKREYQYNECVGKIVNLLENKEKLIKVIKIHSYSKAVIEDKGINNLLDKFYDSMLLLAKKNYIRLESINPTNSNLADNIDVLYDPMNSE